MLAIHLRSASNFVLVDAGQTGLCADEVSSAQSENPKILDELNGVVVVAVVVAVEVK